MATKNQVAPGTEQARLLAMIRRMHFGDDLLSFGERDIVAKNSDCIPGAGYGCAQSILPCGRSSASSSRNKAALIEFAAYAVIVATVIYSVVMNSLPALMIAIVMAGAYIILSHFYPEAAEARDEAEAGNYADLIPTGFGRN